MSSGKFPAMSARLAPRGGSSKVAVVLQSTEECQGKRPVSRQRRLRTRQSYPGRDAGFSSCLQVSLTRRNGAMAASVPWAKAAARLLSLHRYAMGPAVYRERLAPGSGSDLPKPVGADYPEP